jgi:hypothetical protein
MLMIDNIYRSIVCIWFFHIRMIVIVKSVAVDLHESRSRQFLLFSYFPICMIDWWEIEFSYKWYFKKKQKSVTVRNVLG